MLKNFGKSILELFKIKFNSGFLKFSSLKQHHFFSGLCGIMNAAALIGNADVLSELIVLF